MPIRFYSPSPWISVQGRGRFFWLQEVFVARSKRRKNGRIALWACPRASREEADNPKNPPPVSHPGWRKKEGLG